MRWDSLLSHPGSCPADRDHLIPDCLICRRRLCNRTLMRPYIELRFWDSHNTCLSLQKECPQLSFATGIGLCAALTKDVQFFHVVFK
jgi:hypothetical protein